jgi:hypothetical protein
MSLIRRRTVHIRGVGSLVLDIRGLDALDHTTLIAVAKLSLSSWLVAAIVPGVERQPLKKLKTDEKASLLGAK